MQFFTTESTLADDLDAQDELSDFRDEFVITDPREIYLDGNSLGRLPKRLLPYMQEVIEGQWGQRLIRSWNESWFDLPAKLGGKIASLVGAHPEEVVITEATSINLFKLALAAVRARPDRKKIVSDVFNFPSDLYILQGIIDLLGGQHNLQLIPSRDGITIDPQSVFDAIDSDTSLVCLTHVAFKSAYMYDMAEITRAAHHKGALVIWDLSHSAGAVHVDLNGCQADLAVGCTYKYLNGGPGAPAFLYVRRDLQDQLSQPLWGWFASADPFSFGLDFKPAAGLARFQVGTPPVLSMKAIEPAIDLLLQAGMSRLRRKSVMQTEYLIYLADQWLAPLGFSLGSPRQPEIRGSHVSLRHPDGYRIVRAMIESPPPALRVIPDFRSPDNLRLGIAPLYTSFLDIYRAMQRIREIVVDRLYESFPIERLQVT
jgi:kynureninase